MPLPTPLPNVEMRELDQAIAILKVVGQSHKTPGPMHVRLDTKSKVIFLEFHKIYYKSRPDGMASKGSDKTPQ